MSRARRKCLIGLYIVQQITVKIIQQHSIRSHVQYTIMHIAHGPEFRAIKIFTCIVYRVSQDCHRLLSFYPAFIIFHSGMWFKWDASSYLDRNAGILMRLVEKHTIQLSLKCAFNGN